MKVKISARDIWNLLNVGEIGSATHYDLSIHRKKYENIYGIDVFVGTLHTAKAGDVFFIQERKNKTAFLFPGVVVIEFALWTLWMNPYIAPFKWWVTFESAWWDIKQMYGWFTAAKTEEEYVDYEWDLNTQSPFWVAIMSIIEKGGARW